MPRIIVLEENQMNLNSRTSQSRQNKTIRQLLGSRFDQQGLDIEESWNVEVSGLAIDSRDIRQGDVFLAYRGINSDGRSYIQNAIENGAVAVIAEKNKQWEQFSLVDGKTPVFVYPNLKKDIGVLAANYFDNPSNQMKVIGITGTNGKTSCSHFIAEALNLLNKRCAVLGTLGYGFPDQLKASTHTTPDPVNLQKNLKALKDEGASFIAMEASSHALDQGRLNGTVIDAAVLTNITHDHLDYHKSMDQYAEAKRTLFLWKGLNHIVINLDDEYGKQWIGSLEKSNKLNLVGYSRGGSQLSTQSFKRVIAKEITCDINGICFDYSSSWGDGQIENRQILGDCNVDNFLAVIGVLFSFGFDSKAISKVLSKIHGVPGRMEKIQIPDMPVVIVDFAHTPDAFENVLSDVMHQKKGKLICVFGCGGDRDREKRPVMGRIAERLADKVVLTNDNPRSEDSSNIFKGILSEVSNLSSFEVIEDRAKAITSALNLAGKEDVVLVCGKGAESYQEIKGDKIPFSDKAVIESVLKSKKTENGGSKV